MADNDSGPLTRPSLLLRLRDPHDVAAWQTFVAVYGPLVHRYCRSKGLQDADATDVMQEMLIQVSQSIATFAYRRERGRFRDWLWTITRHKVIDFQRKQASRVQAPGQTEETDILENVTAPAQDTVWTETFMRHMVQTALERICPHFEPPTWRAFELGWLKRIPAAEVARELSQKVEWVYMAISRVRKRLEEEIRELTEDVPM